MGEKNKKEIKKVKEINFKDDEIQIELNLQKEYERIKYKDPLNTINTMYHFMSMKIKQYTDTNDQFSTLLTQAWDEAITRDDREMVLSYIISRMNIKGLKNFIEKKFNNINLIRKQKLYFTFISDKNLKLNKQESLTIENNGMK